MLPDSLKELAIPKALDAWEPSAVLGGSYDAQEAVLHVDPVRIVDAGRFLRGQDHHVRLSAVTAIDRYPAEPRFEVVYFLHFMERNERLRLKCMLPGTNPEIESLYSVWPSANWYEREVFDLFGVTFRNHPNLTRILMPDDWNGHPLRKDFPVHGHKYSYQNQ
jgi:NADH-quinone oxidoreductase subunit C